MTLNNTHKQSTISPPPHLAPLLVGAAEHDPLTHCTDVVIAGQLGAKIVSTSGMHWATCTQMSSFTNAHLSVLQKPGAPAPIA